MNEKIRNRKHDDDEDDELEDNELLQVLNRIATNNSTTNEYNDKDDKFPPNIVIFFSFHRSSISL